jgi:hypothetical protein
MLSFTVIVRIICRDRSSEQLLAELSVQCVDVVLADAPISPTVEGARLQLLARRDGAFAFAPRYPAARAKYRPGFRITARRADEFSIALLKDERGEVAGAAWT